ncbi:hypothetical protein ACFYOG_26495 [Streptomyces sp. NPDC007818]|uniref:hypothetical protein n=1 Tax=Streptomyces sp. NPDC007818 TaxID=3364780 RepID=UPI00367EB7FA
MHETRTSARLLAGAAAAVALTGCVAVDGPPPAPSPAPAPVADPVRPAQDVAPQIVLQGPAREALEAALPSPASRTAAPRGETRRATGHAAPSRTPSPEPSSPEPSSPEPSSPAARRTSPPPEPPVPAAAAPGVREAARLSERLPQAPPVFREDVCELGERYGAWDPAGVEAGLCRGAYGR